MAKLKKQNQERDNMKSIKNNLSLISGKIVKNFEFSHRVLGEGFYVANLSSSRKSGNKDIIPIMVSERLVDVEEDFVGSIVRASGQFRSFSKLEGVKRKLELFVFAQEFEVMEEQDSKELIGGNFIHLNGYICKKPAYRKTPLGREVADILLAVNRPYGKSDYIPCVAWGRNARFASGLEVGKRLQIEGRIQSREYVKKVSDAESETRTAYEVSISKMEAVEETEE